MTPGLMPYARGMAAQVMPEDWPHWGRVVLKPFAVGLTDEEWRRFYECFRDPEIAAWNGNRPLRMPLWLFKRVVLGELKRGDRLGFGILDEYGEWIGTIELYDMTAREATLGIIIGAKDRWGQGYGTEAVRALLTYAFERLGLERVRLKTFRHNLRARRAFEKAGFRLVRFEPLPGGKEDAHMEVSREEWDAGLGSGRHQG